MASLPRHGVVLRCWSCGTSHDVRALSTAPVQISQCCFDTLAEVAGAFGTALLHQLPQHLQHHLTKTQQRNDAWADRAVTSPCPEERKAAQEWRNARAAKKSPGAG